MPVVMAVTVWQWTGLTFILFYAAMAQIEPEILEAARIDGASNLRTLVAIVWPMCKGTTIALATLGIIGALKTFDVPYLVTKGGRTTRPSSSARTSTRPWSRRSTSATRPRSRSPSSSSPSAAAS